MDDNTHTPKIDLFEAAQALEREGFPTAWCEAEGLPYLCVPGPGRNAVGLYEDGMVAVEGPYDFGLQFLIAVNYATGGMVVNGMRQHAAEHEFCSGYAENADLIDELSPTYVWMLVSVAARNRATIGEVLEAVLNHRFYLVDGEKPAA